jgi:hypothetical protein
LVYFDEVSFLTTIDPALDQFIEKVVAVTFGQAGDPGNTWVSSGGGSHQMIQCFNNIEKWIDVCMAVYQYFHDGGQRIGLNLLRAQSGGNQYLQQPSTSVARAADAARPWAIQHPVWKSGPTPSARTANRTQIAVPLTVARENATTIAAG